MSNIYVHKWHITNTNEKTSNSVSSISLINAKKTINIYIAYKFCISQMFRFLYMWGFYVKKKGVSVQFESKRRKIWETTSFGEKDRRRKNIYKKNLVMKNIFQKSFFFHFRLFLSCLIFLPFSPEKIDRYYFQHDKKINETHSILLYKTWHRA